MAHADVETVEGSTLIIGSQMGMRQGKRRDREFCGGWVCLMMVMNLSDEPTLTLTWRGSKHGNQRRVTSKRSSRFFQN
jgi:hypothetical protein